MNIDEYRAMKAELEKKNEAPVEPVEDEVIEVAETKPVEEETTPQEADPKEEPKTDVVEIDGVEYTLDELKQGYMRQADYTRKTQELKREKEAVEEALKFMEELQKNPQIANQLSQQFDIPNLDPNTARYRELENKYYDLLIETKVKELHEKYGDFDVERVLQTAYDKRIEDLEVAYHMVMKEEGRLDASSAQSEPVNLDEIKASLREELMKELKSELEANVDTSTIISSSGGQAPVRDKGPKLTDVERRVAINMGMSPEEYAKWRDAK